MNILAIDTSCDETSVAVVQDMSIKSNVISSQVKYHKKYGGVVPFLAQRLHQERIEAVIEMALQRSGIVSEEIDAVAVTYGPGLAPALQVGIASAKELALRWHKPLYAINHMAGHIASCLVTSGSKKSPEILFPALALLVSGGHTELVVMPKFGEFKIIGQTLDDAVGEAYDKVAKMLGLGYPGGKLVANLAKQGDPTVYTLPVPMAHSKDLNFSYSGLKNATRLLIESVKGGTYSHPLTQQEIADICAIFEEVAQKGLLIKVEKAVREYPELKSILVGGGVTANAALRRKIRSLARQFSCSVYFPPTLSLCTDNAAMIGAAAYLAIQAGLQPANSAELERVPNLALGSIE